MRGSFLLWRGILQTGIMLAGVLSCHLWELKDSSGIHTYPSKPNTVVSKTDTLWVSFPFSPDHASAEALFSVKDCMGTVPGRFRWEKNILYFLPEPELKPGARYVLSFRGTVRDSQGRSYEQYCTVPFFYLFKGEVSPYLQSILPSRGEIVSRTRNIVITFSREMDPSSFEKGFTLSPATPHEIQWTDSNRTVQVSPRETWLDRTLYTLSFGEGIADLKGMLLAPTPDTTFLVQEDTDRPYVRSVEVALNDGGSVPPARELTWMPFFILGIPSGSPSASQWRQRKPAELSESPLRFREHGPGWMIRFSYFSLPQAGKPVCPTLFM